MFAYLASSSVSPPEESSSSSSLRISSTTECLLSEAGVSPPTGCSSSFCRGHFSSASDCSVCRVATVAAWAFAAFSLGVSAGDSFFDTSIVEPLRIETSVKSSIRTNVLVSSPSSMSSSVKKELVSVLASNSMASITCRPCSTTISEALRTRSAPSSRNNSPDARSVTAATTDVATESSSLT